MWSVVRPLRPGLPSPGTGLRVAVQQLYVCLYAQLPTVNQKRVVTFPASAAPLNVWSGDVSGLSQSNEIEHCPSFADQSAAAGADLRGLVG